jgi:hypothetical protein
MRSVAGVAAGLLLFAVAGASAQSRPEHVIDGSAAMRTVAAAQTMRDRDRAVVHRALAQPEVQHAAKRLAMDLSRIDAAIDTVNDVDLATLADSARRANQALVGGASTVTISTTTIIIGLLVLILIIVAVK